LRGAERASALFLEYLLEDLFVQGEIERFNGRLRDEHLNTELFFSVADAQAKLLEWQRDYNEVRPHSSLGQIPPRESWPRGS